MRSAPIMDLLREVNDPNYVTVTHYRRERAEKCAPAVMRRVMHERFGPGVMNESGVLGGINPATGRPRYGMLDRMRLRVGLRPVYLREMLRLAGGDLVAVRANLRTTVGIDYTASALGDSSGSRLAATDYIAVSSSATAPAVGHTFLAGGTGNESAVSGMVRKIAAYVRGTGGATAYTYTATFTAGATATNIQLAGIFVGAATSTADTGTLFLENTFTATTLASADQLAITWTVNI